MNVSTARNRLPGATDRPAVLAHLLARRHGAQRDLVSARNRLERLDHRIRQQQSLMRRERAQRHRDVIARIDAPDAADCELWLGGHGRWLYQEKLLGFG